MVLVAVLAERSTLDIDYVGGLNRWQVLLAFGNCDYPPMLQQCLNMLHALTSHCKLKNGPSPGTGMTVRVCLVQLGGEEVFLDFLVLLDDPHQFWGDRVKESLEEFCHASSFHG